MTDPFDTVREALKWAPEVLLNFTEGEVTGLRSGALAALASIESLTATLREIQDVAADSRYSDEFVGNVARAVIASGKAKP